MHNIKLNDVEYSFPESIDELTLDSWEKIQARVINRITDKYTYDDILDITEIITGVEREIILESPVEVFNTLYALTDWIYKVDFSKIKPVNSLTIDGVVYAYSTNENISLREWVDIDTIISKFDDEQKFAGILAVRLRPQGVDYTPEYSEEILNRIQFWKKQKAVDVMPIVNFFLLRENLSYQNMKSYLMAVQVARLQMLHIKNSVKNGDGTIRWWNWRKKILTKLIPYLEKEYTKCYHSCLTVQTKVMQHLNNKETIYNKK